MLLRDAQECTRSARVCATFFIVRSRTLLQTGREREEGREIEREKERERERERENKLAFSGPSSGVTRKLVPP
jgi:hypothetical protein